MVRTNFLLILIGLLLSNSSFASDPSLSWKTIQTAHFDIHYHQGLDSLAFEVADKAEIALERVSQVLSHQTNSKIQLVISDIYDSANGSAQVLPYSIVNVYAYPPGDLSTLNAFSDHIWSLLVHELTHIVHMDTVSGLPRIINWIFGATLYPNGAQPNWLVEGFAINNESSISSLGRIQSSLTKMIVRTAALADKFPGFDQISGNMHSWPQGNFAYVYGGFFVDFLVRNNGSNTLSKLSHEIGSRLNPWALNQIARQELGSDYLSLYEEWKTQVEQDSKRTLADLEKEGLSAFFQITERGQNQRRPRIDPRGKNILYYSSPVNGWPSLRLVNVDSHKDISLLEVNGEGGAAFLPSGQQIIFSQPEIYDQFYVYQDLYLFDIRTKTTKRLTFGERAHSPDVALDGQSVVYVKSVAGRSQLHKMSLLAADHLQQPQQLTNFKNKAQVYSPRFSPDSKQIVFSAQQPKSGRNIILLNLETDSIQQLTDSPAMDLNPVFSKDGKSIYFSSDRTGIYNLYQLFLKDNSIKRITNLATGAFYPEPSPDGFGLAFMVYGPTGYDIAWLDLPAKTINSKYSKTPDPTPDNPDQQSSYPELATSNYNPLATLWPRAWIPVWGQDLWGSTYGAFFSGRDVLSKLGYSTELTYGPENNQFYIDLGIWTHVIYPILSFYLGRHVYRYNREAAANNFWYPIDKEKITLYFDASFPFSSIRQNHSISISYELGLYDSWTQLPRGPRYATPLFPDDSPLTWLSLGWYYSCVERYIYSISAEKGFTSSIYLRLSHPLTGSGFKLLQSRASFRIYFPIVPKLQHVLALGLRGGITTGDARRKSAFVIGGLPLRDPIQDAYFGYRFGGLYLRGYPLAAFSGSAFFIGSAEYRFPVANIEGGIFSLPIFFKRLHASLFVDTGGTSDGELTADLFNVGLGGELRLDMLIAYHLAMTLRLGYARGLSSEGSNNFFLVLGAGF
jgi:Tol biopolymer transport system component